MIHTLQALLAPAVMERLTLLLNHVLSSEAVATARLLPHAGRCISVRLANWPSLLPAPPPLTWAVTPAGLLEWCADGAPRTGAGELSLEIDAGNPALLLAQTLAGETPAVQIDGDAQFAGDVNWLLQNLRWDIAADLERLFGPVVAQQLSRLGAALAQGLRSAVRTVGAVGERLRPRSP